MSVMLKIVNQTNSKILISSPKNTSLEDYTWFVLIFIFGSVFSLIPMYMALMSSSVVGILRINCDRVEPQQVDCQLSKSKFFDSVQQEPLNYKFVNSVKYNAITSKDSDGDTIYSYNFSLLTKSGKKVPFQSSSSSTAIRVTSVLNTFLQSKQESFRYILDERFEPNRYIVFVFISLFIAVGLSIIWGAFSSLVDYEEILLDKSEYQLRHSKRTLLGTKFNRFLFMEIAKVDVLYETDSYKNIFFTPRITMNSKLQFKLDAISDRQVAIKIANDLNRFMGLPEEEDPVVKA
jgi:hypothetical protein